MKANEPGRIGVTCADMAVEDQLFYRISVSENGTGFEPEFRERILHTFTRLHPVDDYEGTGLGLAICKKIAEWHGGSISAVGQPEQGATITILLPAVRK